MKIYLLLFFFAINFRVYAQNSSTGIPDSAVNIPIPGAQGQYGFTNPLNHNGSSFTNSPVAVLISPNTFKAGYLYFYDFDLNMPAGAIINGIEVIHNSGGCNSGSYTIDSMFLAYEGQIISDAKRDSNSIFIPDTLGSSTDLWSAILNPNIVNSNSFGVMLSSTTSGICTYSQSDLRLKVYYTLCSNVSAIGIPDSSKSLPLSGATLSYNNVGLMFHNGSGFVNAPTAVLTPNNNRSNYLYFYDFDFNIPSAATISGVEFMHQVGACNSGSHTRDTVYLSHNESIISDFRWDSTSIFRLNMLGSDSDLWSANLTPSIVNDNSFGIILHSTGYGVCTYGQFDAFVTVYYCLNGTSYIASSSQKIESKVFPNPGSNFVNIEIPSESLGTNYKIIDINGRTCAVGILQNEINLIDISELQQGIYFIVYQSDLLKNVKLIKI
jgi:hypothetical protein